MMANATANQNTDSERLRRRQITRAAIECVAEGGIDGATVRRVAERAGVSTGMVSYYYATKKELITAAIAAAAEDFNLLLNDLLKGDFGPRRLDKVGELVLLNRSKALMPVSFWIEFWSEAARDDDLRAQFLAAQRRNLDYYRKSIGVAADGGRFPAAAADTESAARLIAALLTGLTIHAALAPEETSPRTALSVFRYALSLMFDRDQSAATAAERLKNTRPRGYKRHTAARRKP
jgi:AcrR family transcriptional regulator